MGVGKRAWSPARGHSLVPVTQSGRTDLCSGGTDAWENDGVEVWEPDCGDSYSRNILRHIHDWSPGDNDQMIGIGHSSVGTSHQSVM